MKESALMPDRLLRLLSDPETAPWVTSFLVFIGASFAGLATALRDGRDITLRQFANATLNSGLLGLILFMLGYNRLKDDLPFLIGLSLLAGIGSASLMTFAVQLLKRRLTALIGGDGDRCKHD